MSVAAGGSGDSRAASLRSRPDRSAVVAAASSRLTVGLSSADVNTLQHQYGRNESIEHLTHPLVVFALKFTSLSSLLLAAVVAISLGLSNYVDSVVVGLLLLANAILSWIQDMRARKAVQQLQNKMQLQARVCREGKWETISAAELVPGDIIRLRFGDSVGADCVVLDGECSVDQSALTGESELFNKEVNADIYGGSMLKGGECTAVVVATGSLTFYGRTAQLVQSSKPNVHVDRIVRNVSIALLAAVIIMLIIAVVVTASRGQNMVDIVTLLLVLLVSAIPVALPAMFTVSMAIGSKELVKNDVLVTRLNATEDCASMTVLCCDKTGTLTQNKLAVQTAWINPLSALQTTDNEFTPPVLIHCAALASRIENHDPVDQAVLAAHQINEKQSSTETETEIHTHISPHSGDSFRRPPALPSLRSLFTLNPAKFHQLQFYPFDAKTRRTESILHIDYPVEHHTEAEAEAVAASPAATGGLHLQVHPMKKSIELRVCKGAANTLMDLCHCSAQERELAQQQIRSNAEKGYRSMAVAAAMKWTSSNASVSSLSLSPSSSSALRDDPSVAFHLLGVFSLHDPVRPDSASVLRELHALGVQVKMLTGDAHAVAVQTARVLNMGLKFVNIHSDSESAIAAASPRSGSSPSPVGVSASPSTEWNYEWLSADGFAEVYPADKHRIVSALQRAGHIVGMTGDGVNDSPSLKQAEVGVAVSNATDVAKSAASVVLLAEGLAGILVLIHVGRSIHRRIVTWIINKIAKTLQTTLFVVISFFITGFFPINAFDMVLLLLLIDFVTISLATDRVRVSQQPEKWDILPLIKVAAVLGVLSAGEAIAFAMICVYEWQMTQDEVNTISFELLYFFGIFTTFAAREDRFFFSSVPSSVLISVCVVEGIGVIIVCSLGVPELTAIIYWRALIVPVYAAGCSFLINDMAKMIYFQLQRRSATPLTGLQQVVTEQPPAIPETDAPTHPETFIEMQVTAAVRKRSTDSTQPSLATSVMSSHTCS